MPFWWFSDSLFKNSVPLNTEKETFDRDRFTVELNVFILTMSSNATMVRVALFFPDLLTIELLPPMSMMLILSVVMVNVIASVSLKPMLDESVALNLNCQSFPSMSIWV